MNSTGPDAYTNSTSPSTELIKHLEMFVFTLNFLFGLPTHSYVIWPIITGSKSRIASEFFILNLSVCEIANSVNSFFYILSTVFPCLTTLVTFLQGLAISSRPLFQCLICVERYLAVVHPVTFLKYKPLRYRVICCTAAWIIILGSCVTCLTTLMLKNLNAHSWFFLMQFLLFFSIQLFCLVCTAAWIITLGPCLFCRFTLNPPNLGAFVCFFLVQFLLLLSYSVVFPSVCSQSSEAVRTRGLIYKL